MRETMQSNYPNPARPPASVMFAICVVLAVFGGGVYVLCSLLK
jgi:hypothetical protein